MVKLKPIIEESFLQYAGAVLQSRSLVDARDCLKPSARQIFYCLYTDKFIHSKPFKKTLKAIGSAFRTYIHGDSSAEGIIMRAGQPFAMRYPLVEIEGSYGNLIESSNWSAPRYTSARLSQLSEYLFSDLDKETINEWRDNYDNTEKYPSVLPSKGYYNICNGTFGIAVAAATSIPQYNLKEVNDALIKLLWNPDIDFEEICCLPDFATGAFLLNEEEVKEAMKNGQGKSCRLRSKIEFDSNERCLIVTEIPYMVYTNTICQQLEEIINGENNPGIDRFNDLTGATPLIKIYLNKKANPDKILKYLYKNTSLQYYYGINFTILENGRYPKLFTWKQMLQSHIEHEKQVYKRGFEFDLNKIKHRIHILDALLIALAQVEEVIQIIKSSSSTKEANKNLCEKFIFDEEQAKAILDIKLARLAHLEAKKFENEKKELEFQKEKLISILNDEVLLKKEIEKGLKEVAEKFGDTRRTKVLNLSTDNDEVIEKKSIQVSLTNENNIYVTEQSSLYLQKRGGVGNKIKLNKKEFIKTSISCENTDTILFFTKKGSYYHYLANALPIEEKIPVESLFLIDDEICSIAPLCYKKYIIFVTKNGLIKKTDLSEYNTNRKGAVKAIKLDNTDEICSVIFTDDEKIGTLSSNGNFIIFETNTINPISRITRGIKAIDLNSKDYVVSARAIPNNTQQIISINKNGIAKQTNINEFTVQSRGGKGVKIQKCNNIVDFIPIIDETEILISSNYACIKIAKNEIPLSGRNTTGVRLMKIRDNDKILALSKF